MDAAPPDAHWWNLFWRESQERSCMPEGERVLEAIWRSLLMPRLQSSHRVLEIGSGRAWLSKLVARIAAEKGVSVDITASDLVDLGPDHASQLRASGIQWRGGVDAAALPFENASFDIVCGQWSIEYAPDRAAALRECVRVLKPGGLIGFVCHHRQLSEHLVGHLGFMLSLLDEGFFNALRQTIEAENVPISMASVDRLTDRILAMKRRGDAQGLSGNAVVRHFLQTCARLVDEAARPNVLKGAVLQLIDRCEKLVVLDLHLDDMRLRHALDQAGAADITAQFEAAGLRSGFQPSDICWRIWAEKPAV